MRLLESGLVLTVVLSAGGCGGCDEGAPVAASLEDDPIYQRYPSSISPYRVRDGAAPPRSIWYWVGDAIQQEDIYPLTATVAIDAHTVGIVFPPEDRVGFDLALTGIDRPWTRIPLTNVALDQIGALDAVATPDGAVHVVFRERGAPKTLTHVTVARGGAVTTETVPRPGPAIAPWFADRCPDVTLGVTPAGELDLVYRHDIAGQLVGAVATQLVYARRRAGSWQREMILDGRDVPAPSLRFYDYGCRNVINYDDTDEPIVLALARQLGTDDTQASDLDPESRNTMVALIRGVGGAWHAGGIGFAREAQDADSFRGELDLERHPRGALLGATSYAGQDIWLAGFALRHPFGENPGEPIQAWSRTLARDADLDVRSGGKLVIDPCGGGKVLAWHRITRDFYRIPVAFGTVDCSSVPSFAPVIHRDVDLVTPVRYPSYTHGPRAFTAATCLGPGRELLICYGQHEQSTTDLPPRLATEEEILRFASTSIPDGATEVPTSLTSITYQMSPQVLVGHQLVDVTDARNMPTRVIGVDDATSAVTVQLDQPLVAGHLYRFTALGAPLSDEYGASTFWHYVDVKYPSITFRAACTSVTRPDPRTVTMKLVCTGTRGTDGVCDLPGPISPLANAATLVLSFDRRFDPISTATGFRVVDSTSTPSAFASFSTDPVGGEVRVTWTGPLRAGEPYTIELPALTDVYGQTLDPVDRTIRFTTTTNVPPAVFATTPATNTTGVSTTAPLFVDFTEAMAAGTLIAPNVELSVYMSGSPLALTLSMDTPSRLRIVPPTLVADTVYELDLSSVITDSMGQALVGAPYTVIFRTAP